MQNNKRKRLISAIVSIIVLSAYSVTNVGATTKSFLVDNDTSNSNYSNNSNTYTHYSGTWGTYLNSGYNGDSRLRTSTTVANYEWVWNGNFSTTNKVKWEAGVYLADNRFTDPEAQYHIMKDTIQYMSVCYFDLNQNLAPNGFSYFSGTCTPYETVKPWYAYLRSSGLANVGTGADAFYAYFSFK